MIPREHRLKHMKDFDILFKEGRFIRGNFISLKVWKIDSKSYPRYEQYIHTLVGFVVGKKVHKSAVKRNLIKRRMRAALQKMLKEKSLKEKHLVAVLAFPLSHGASYKDLYEDIEKTFNRAKLFV